MPDPIPEATAAEAKVTTEVKGTRAVTEPLPTEAKEVVSEPDSKAAPVVDPNVKALQRELQRARNQLNQTGQLTTRLDGLQVAVDGLVHALGRQPELDDEARATLNQVQQLRQGQTSLDTRRQAVEKEIHDVVESIGVQSWDDPRVADVVAEFEGGDLLEALAVAKSLRRQARAKSEADTGEVELAKTKVVDSKASDETRIKAEVQRQLKEMGVLEVDRTKTAGPVTAKSWADAQKIKKTTDLSDKEYEALISG